MKDENAFSQEQRPVVYLVGIGMGGEDQLTGRAMDCLEAAQVITGADRMLESVRPYTEGHRILQRRGSSCQGIHEGRMGCGIRSRRIQPVLFLRQTGEELAECASGQQPWTGV